MRISQNLSRAIRAAAVLTIASSPAMAAGSDADSACAPKDVKHTERHWSFQGVFGHFDHDAALRGFEVYRNVCAGCHSLDLFAFRNLAKLGATEAEIKGVAKEYEVPALPNEDGEVLMRPALPSDNFPAPFPNEQAAAASNGGAAPPDLSLITKARATLENHVGDILAGYSDPPAGCEIPEGMYYNTHFPGYAIAMAPPLSYDDAVEYNDGTEATVAQMSHDLTQFLTFVGEPSLEERKVLGLKVIIFLVIFTILLYLVKRQVWRNLH